MLETVDGDVGNIAVQPARPRSVQLVHDTKNTFNSPLLTLTLTLILNPTVILTLNPTPTLSLNPNHKAGRACAYGRPTLYYYSSNVGSAYEMVQETTARIRNTSNTQRIVYKFLKTMGKKGFLSRFAIMANEWPLFRVTIFQST